MGGGNAQKTGTELDLTGVNEVLKHNSDFKSSYGTAETCWKDELRKGIFSGTFFFEKLLAYVILIKNAGGGKKGMEARSGGDMAAAMAAAQGEKLFCWLDAITNPISIHVP